MRAPLIDAHCHPDVAAFDEDRDAMLLRARDELVHIVAVGAGRREAGPHGALDIARAWPGFVSVTIGIHPHDASLACPSRLDEIERLASDPLVVGIGETGLDHHYDHSPRDAQEHAFRAQVAIARRAKKPIVVHTRSAPAATLDILREEHASDVGGVIHCFSEDAAFAAAALDLGFVSSFSGLVTFPKAGAILDAAKRQPDDAILVETDAPFLAPVPHRGRRNEPAYVARIAAFLAAARGVDEDAFRLQTTRNAVRLFGLRLPAGVRPDSPDTA